MADRPRVFDDLAGIAGGALSALSGLEDEKAKVAVVALNLRPQTGDS